MTLLQHWDDLKSVLRTFLQAAEKYGKGKRSGRPCEVLATDKRIFLSEAHEEQKAVGQPYQLLDLRIGKKTIKQILRSKEKFAVLYA